MTHASIALRSSDQDHAAELERNAYNAAFYELGLRWYWDTDTFSSLQAFSNPCDRIRRYIETQHPHLLRAYDAEFLSTAIETKVCGFRDSAQSGLASSAYFNWAESRAAELGV
jgi:hypothetical protein